MKIYRTIIAFALVTVTAFLSGCVPIGPGGGTASPGNTATREYDFTNFDSIDVGSAFEVAVTRSDTYRVSITAGENLFNNIIVEKQGSTLRISIRNFDIFFRSTYRADISLPDLKNLTLSGAVRGTADDVVSSGDMAINLSGAATLSVNATAAGTARIEATGASRISGNLKSGAKSSVTASGASTCALGGSSGGDGSIDGSGASTLDLKDFTMPNAGVRLSGASNATVNVPGKLDVDISGASHLKYLGNPTINTINVSGGSSVEKG